MKQLLNDRSMAYAFLFIAIAACLAFSADAQDVYRVDPGAHGDGSGATWFDAVTDLQAAIDLASDNDEVWVRSGTYTAPEFGFLIRDKWNLRVRGGFAGDESSPEERGFNAGPSVLSAERGDPNDPTDNSIRVLNVQDTHPIFQFPVLIEDFTIKDGYSWAPVSRGAGITTSSVVLTLRRCTLENNLAETGAAIWAGTAQQTGKLFAVDCLFRDNMAIELPTGTGIRFNGGAVSVAVGTFVRCTFERNHAGTDGGAVSMNLATFGPLISFFNCRFDHNTAGRRGGAITIGSAVSPSRPLLISHCTFTNGSASESGGAVYANSQMTINGQNAYVWLGSSAFWNNTAPADPDAGGDYGGIRRCLIAGVGGDNIDMPPKFRDAANGDFRPSPASPLIDAGWDEPLLTDILDFDGDEVFEEVPITWIAGTDTSPERPLGEDLADIGPDNTARLLGGISDIGAYEHCRGDVNASGTRTTDDFAAWFIAFNAGEQFLADVNRDGVATPRDFTAWLELFALGRCEPN